MKAYQMIEIPTTNQTDHSTTTHYYKEPDDALLIDTEYTRRPGFREVEFIITRKGELAGLKFIQAVEILAEWNGHQADYIDAAIRSGLVALITKL